jgi:N-acetylmuramoyl-L-alanine amidase
MIKWKPIRKVEYIVIHCAATTEDHDVDAEEIRGWHLQRGWLDIGYHKVIKRDGTIEDGRELTVPGAHARGFNHKSWGICLAGGVESDNKTPEANYTHAQWESLEWLVRDMLKEVPNAKVLGHRDLPNVSKACPSFDVPQWWASRQDDNVIEFEFRPPLAD